MHASFSLYKFVLPKLKEKAKLERIVVPAGYWSDIENRSKWLQEVGKKLGIKSNDDWYKVSRSDFEKNGGNKISKYYRGSLPATVESLIPHNWETWKFESVSRGFWTSREHQKRFLDKFAAKHNFKSTDPSAWVDITEEMIKLEGGSGLLTQFVTLTKALEACYPDMDFSIRKNKPSGHWKSLSNQREFLEKVAKEMNISIPNGWYSVSYDDIGSRGGYGLLNEYQGSFIKALQKVFPEHIFLPWKFTKVYPNFWSNEENVRQYISWLANQLSIKIMEDWYSVSAQQFIDSGAKSLISIYGGVFSILSKYFPDYPWDPLEFSTPKIPKTQNLLAYMVQNILRLRGSDVFSDYVHPVLIDKATGKPMMLNVYVPEYNIAIEYEGIQNNKDQNLDSKKIACKENGISLITFPKTWDQSEATLRTALEQVAKKESS